MLEKKPKVVLFDFGGTLVENGKSDTIKALDAMRLAALNPEVTSADELYKHWKRVINKLYISREGTLPENPGVETPLTLILRNIIDAVGLKYDISLTECGIILDTEHFTDRRQTKNIDILLKKLKELGIRTGVISNTTMNEQEMGAAIKIHIKENHFEWIMTSADYIFMKPESDMFEIAAKRMGVSPEDCLYCGDDFTNDVIGPSRVGMTGLFYDINAELPFEKKEMDGKTHYVINDWLELANRL